MNNADSAPRSGCFYVSSSGHWQVGDEQVRLRNPRRFMGQGAPATPGTGATGASKWGVVGVSWNPGPETVGCPGSALVTVGCCQRQSTDANLPLHFLEMARPKATGCATVSSTAFWPRELLSCPEWGGRSGCLACCEVRARGECTEDGQCAVPSMPVPPVEVSAYVGVFTGLLDLACRAATRNLPNA